MVNIFDSLAGSTLANVFAVNRIQSQISEVQGRLSTGLRVNSPIDNPTSFFLASSLGNRASQLGSVLDTIASRISTLQQASESVSALTELAESLKSKAEDAQEVLSSNPATAELTSSRNLSAVTDLSSLAGIDNNDQLVFSYVDTTGAIASSTVTINSNDSTNDLLTAINGITDSGANQVFEATLNSAGQINIKTQNSTRFEIDFQDNLGAGDKQLVAALGFGGYTSSEVDNGTGVSRITATPNPSLTTVSLFDRNAGTTARTSTTLLNLSDTAGGPAGDIFDGDANDALSISVDGGTPSTVVSDISTATVQDIIDGINDNGSLNSKIKASFDSSTGELNIRAIDSTVESIQFELTEDGAAAGTAGKIDLQQLGLGAQVLQSAADGSGLKSSESLLLGPGAAELATLEEEFNDLRTQIDELVDDSEFDDVNLLNGDDLVTVFNATGSNALTTEGGTLKVDNIGISEANFGNSDNIAGVLDEVNDALDYIERFSDALATDLSVVETRESFTEGTISNLNIGVNNLTSADEEADSALLQALQARQVLSVTVLSLTSQEQDSVLRLL